MCNDVHFGERSISDCDETFAVSLISIESVVLRHAPLYSKGTIFLYIFQPLIFVLIVLKWVILQVVNKVWRGLLPPRVHQGLSQTPTILHGVTIPKATI
jgi:hypothetical protein